jgi:hypothetical protein
MKKARLIAFSLVAMLGLTFFLSCEAESESVSMTGTEENSSVMDDATLMQRTSSFRQIFRYDGPVQFRIFENEVTAYYKQDGRTNFTIIQECTFRRELQDGAYRVVVYDYGVTFESQENGQSYFFGIEDANSRNLLVAVGESRFISDLSGKGLVYHWGRDAEFDFTFEEMRVAPVKSVYFLAHASLLADGCDSGGRGSSACSLNSTTGGSSSGCSTTCTSGFYACCKKATWNTRQSCKCNQLGT